MTGKKSQNENFHCVKLSLITILMSYLHDIENYDGKILCFLLVQPIRLESQSSYLNPPWITFHALSSENIISISKENLEIQLVLSVFIKNHLIFNKRRN